MENSETLKNYVENMATIQQEAEKEIKEVQTPLDVTLLQRKYLGSKGLLTTKQPNFEDPNNIAKQAYKRTKKELVKKISKRLIDLTPNV